MKKIYEAPSCKEYFVEIQSLMALSDLNEDNADSDAMGREGGSWFSED